MVTRFDRLLCRQYHLPAHNSSRNTEVPVTLPHRKARLALFTLRAKKVDPGPLDSVPARDYIIENWVRKIYASFSSRSSGANSGISVTAYLRVADQQGLDTVKPRVLGGERPDTLTRLSSCLSMHW